MLPAAPKTLGRLSDVFISALGSITGKENRLGFSTVNRACVILVDGLGSENLRAASGHAPFLNSTLKASKSINTVFPSTTASAITSFGTGLKPSQHGIHGYSIFDRQAGVVRNMLTGWNEDASPQEYQPHPTVAMQAASAGVQTYTVGPAEYEATGFTVLNMRGSKYLPAKTFEDRVIETRKLLNAKSKSLTYLYFPELDSTAHAFGVESTEWLNKLEELDFAMRTLTADVPTEAGLVLTADHGIVDVARDDQILLDEFDLPGLISVSGDPRNSFLYFDSGMAVSAAIEALSGPLEGKCFIATAAEVIEKGWLGPHEVSNRRFLPDLYLISNGNYACYHRGFAKPQSLRMIGQHGGISTSELSVPLLKFGGYRG
jgi:hypothetical protein